jgi:hypothetical protein
MGRDLAGAMAYSYEIFISYPRNGHVCEWVRTHFHPLLEGWLNDNVSGDEPRVFIDSTMDPGTTWPNELRVALRGSRLLVPVFSGQYFRSEWCVWELESMLAREQLLGMRTDADPRGLIFPVRYSNGVRQDLANIQYMDLQPYNVPVPSYRETKEFTGLVKEVEAFASVLVSALGDSPQWQEGWPISTPPVDARVTVGLPRLG